jgi:ABC-type transport system involved in cytochrome c biogenesis permease subunit
MFLCQHARASRLPEEQQILEERQLWMLDRQQYRMILWALPLLSLGIVMESLLLMQQGNFPSPSELWTVKRESFLALATWFCCGIYLHTRLFFAWRDVRSSVFYLTAFALILAANLSEHFLNFH